MTGAVPARDARQWIDTQIQGQFAIVGINIVAACQGVKHQFFGGFDDYRTLLDSLRE